jgi:hypothetical protein
MASRRTDNGFENICQLAAFRAGLAVRTVYALMPNAMDYINNKGEKIGSLTTVISNDRSVTINRLGDVTTFTTRDPPPVRCSRRLSSAICLLGSND